MRRRTFLTAAAGLAGQSLQPRSMPVVRLGIDVFSLRSQNWTPFESLDFAAKWRLQVVHFSEIRFLGSLEPENLRKVREHAARLGIEVEIGMKSICPTSKSFDTSQGTAEEQLTRMITAATVVGSPIVRAVLGSGADRTGPVPLETHIENTVRVLRAVRSRAQDAGIKFAIENHAGDLQARELKSLVEAAGTDFVGVCLDTGNPLWAIEDPHLTLETLAPYVLTSHVRDSYVWRTPEGAAVQWVRMGEGNIDIPSYLRAFIEKCPGSPLSLEIIVSGTVARPFYDHKFWDGFRQTPAWEFTRFLALAEKGSPRPAPPHLPKEEAVRKEREDLEASLRYVQEFFKI